MAVETATLPDVHRRSLPKRHGAWRFSLDQRWIFRGYWAQAQSFAARAAQFAGSRNLYRVSDNQRAGIGNRYFPVFHAIMREIHGSCQAHGGAAS